MGVDQLHIYADAAAWWDAASPVLIRACSDAGIGMPTAKSAVVEVPRIYYRSGDWRTADGAFSSLAETARAGYANVILSNHAPELPELVDALGFGHLVERTITSASLGVEKPNPIMFQTALRLTGGAPDSWMIGDNPTTDIAGARAVGMRALLVHRSDGSNPPLTLVEASAKVIRFVPTAG